MPGWSRRARTRLDLWSQVLWNYRITSAATALAIFGLISTLVAVPLVVNVLVAAAGVLFAATEVVVLRARARSVVFQHRENDDYQDVVEAEQELGRAVRTLRDVAVLLEGPSRLLRAQGLPATIDAASYTLDDHIAPWSLHFLNRSARRATLHDGPLVGLASDLPDIATATTVVRLRRCTYFQFLCSNLLAPYDATELGGGRSLRGRQLFLNRYGRLRSVGSSWLANAIGVSTLAFCTDGKVLLVHQSAENMGSPGLIAPSGSGALEQQDLAVDAELTLQEIVVRGVERELCEEGSIQPGEVLATSVIGHARWLSRGAMPEFAAITFLGLDSHEVIKRRIRRTERAYVAGYRMVRLAPIDSWDPAQPLRMLPSEDRHGSSLPLAVTLSFLAEAIHDENWEPGPRLRALIEPEPGGMG